LQGAIVAEIFHTLGELFLVLGKLIVELLAFGLQWLLLIFWVAWWLAAVNWKKAWPVLAGGGWVVVTVLTVIAAFVWSQLAPSTPTVAGLVLPAFWWQLGASALIVGSALFAGWLQGVLGWTPTEIDLEPPTHAEHEHEAPIHHQALEPMGNGHHP
jgi:hypothetical protein